MCPSFHLCICGVENGIQCLFGILSEFKHDTGGCVYGYVWWWLKLIFVMVVMIDLTRAVNIYCSCVSLSVIFSYTWTTVPQVKCYSMIKRLSTKDELLIYLLHISMLILFPVWHRYVLFYNSDSSLCSYFCIVISYLKSRQHWSWFALTCWVE